MYTVRNVELVSIRFFIRISLLAMGCCSSNEKEEEPVVLSTPIIPIIYVKLLNERDVVYKITFESTDTVLTFKEKVQEISGIPANAQRLIYNGQQLDDTRVISAYGIRESTTLNLVKRQNVEESNQK